MAAGPNRVRRRRWAGALVLVTAAGGAAIGAAAGGGAAEPVASRTPTATPTPAVAAQLARRRARLERLSPARLAGEAVVLRYTGTSVPAYVRRALREGRAAGVILFADNVPDAAVTRRATTTLQRSAGGDAIVSVDQEGGTVRRMRWVAPRRSQRERGSAEAAAKAARASGRQLAALGVTVALAPVADVGRPGSALYARTFPGDTRRTAGLVAAAVRGYAGTGVSPTVKHFPGLGAARANTDDAPADVDLSADVLGRTDLPPFAAAIAAGVPAVMLSHARYPALDPDHIASQSPAVVTDLLKRRMGFKGVAMTDALEAAAVTRRSGPGEAAVRSVGAGIDLVVTTGPGSHHRVVDALARRAGRSRAFRARLVDAALRVRALRDRS